MARANMRTTGLRSGCEEVYSCPTLLQRHSGKAKIVLSRSGAGKPHGDRLQKKQKTKGRQANVKDFLTFIEK